MAYRTCNRYQMAFLPQSIEEYVSKDDPIRAYDAFVEVLDFNELGIDINPYKDFATSQPQLLHFVSECSLASIKQVIW